MSEHNIQRLGHHGDGIAPGPVFAPLTLPGEVVTGTLEDIVSKVREANLKSPAVFVVGEVVALRDQLTVLTQVAEQQRDDVPGLARLALVEQQQIVPLLQRIELRVRA